MVGKDGLQNAVIENLPVVLCLPLVVSWDRAPTPMPAKEISNVGWKRTVKI
ncbi:hypothetical protein GDI1980 [Gluconacetobacter diazotrophicus PA1 5]|uniref:Uncharacterized protein n=1 Tax=Gluconacetobacter diazotrophicus (strain ATCC 49037 / DSM 5601 / CCUG 37298 / CIP 103539 / LMG 7603 / PAl5) TaxID=272568 RepID=A9HJL6_GLUDA|nr:hypothetical protein GDI1980 [Gluconacetobacter diazotrophicus PA1 5]